MLGEEAVLKTTSFLKEASTFIPGGIRWRAVCDESCTYGSEGDLHSRP